MLPEPLEDALKQSALLKFLPEDHRERLAELFTQERYEFGDVIVNQGDEADAFYVLASGRARVVKITDQGKEMALHSLRPGSEFGESALLDGGTRTATVRCSTTAEVLRLGRDDFLELLAEHPDLRRHLETTARFKALHGFLYQFTNFGRLSIHALHHMVESLTPLDVPKGGIIIREGDPAGPMYIVQTGRVRAFTNHHKKTRNLGFYREGDFFGELSLLNGSARAASAEAMTDTRLLALSPEVVLAMRRQYPEFSKLLEERLAIYNKGTEARVPLDFTSELLPAEASMANKVALNGASDGAESADDHEEPFADESGRVRKKRGRIRSFPHVLQIDEMDCGVASLAMICRYFGRKVSLSRIRELCHTSLDGTSLKAICHAATELGLAARPLKVSIRHLDSIPLPAIAHWDGNHWVCLYDVTKSHVRVSDPALSNRRIPRAEFEAKWSGYTALFDYTEAFLGAPETRSPLTLLLPLLRQFSHVLTPAILLAVVVSFLEILFPVFSQMVVDKVIVDNDLGLLRTIMIAMAATLVFYLGANLIQQYLLSFAALHIDTVMLDFLTRKLLALPMSYFASRRTGDIQRRLDGARQVRQFLVQHGIGGLLAVIHLCGAITLMALYSPALMGVFLLTTPLYGGLMLFSAKVLRPLFADIEESQGKYSSHQIDAIKGMEGVKAAAAESVFREAMLGEFLSVAKKLFRSNFILLSYESVLRTIGLISTGLFLWFGAVKVIRHELTVGEFVAFSSLTALAYAAILRALGIWDNMQLISVLLNRLNDVFEPEPEQGADRSRLRAVPHVEGRIELRNVGFKYGGNEAPDILKNLTFEIGPGRMVAIVGRSGCGKTTLIKLLAGLLEATEGTILIDHVDLKTVNYREMRRQIGMVLQENHMFNETIARNISFGDSEADFERVLSAAQIANAHDFIMRLPLGYETRIGESGLALSGGQKQRIAIARAVYSNPPILIFDEATSALDTESERAIQDNLTRLMAGRTSIVIAHRLSTIRDADTIIVLEKGQVAEIGNHDQLMEKRGIYFYLSSQQLQI